MVARLNRINAPYILWLIREGKVQSIDNLREHFAPIFETTRYSREANKILIIVNNLIAAGMIIRNKNSLSSTSLIEKIQAGLDMSLTDLVTYDPNSISVNPIFGKPRSNNLMPE